MTSFIARPTLSPLRCVHLAVLGTIGGGLASSALEFLLLRLGAVTARHCCCRSRPLRPPSFASGVSRPPSQASSRVGNRSCRRGSDGKTSGTAFVPRPTIPLLTSQNTSSSVRWRGRLLLSMLRIYYVRLALRSAFKFIPIDCSA
jgi:hypothetical protein